MQQALDLILPKIAKVIQNLQIFALKYKDLPVLGFTHYQPVSLMNVGVVYKVTNRIKLQAQLITVGMNLASFSLFQIPNTGH